MRRLRTLVQSASHMLVVMGLDRTIIWVNKAWETRTGYALDEVRGHNPGQFLRCEDTGPEVGPTLRREMEAGRRVSLDMLCESRGGERYWLNIDVQPTYGPDGALDGYVAVHTDITERKAQEQAAIAARNRLQATLTALPDIVLELDNEGRFTAVHVSDLGKLTAPPDRLIGGSLEDMLPPEIAAIGRAIMAEVDARGVASGYRYQLETLEGRRWFEMSAAMKPSEHPGAANEYILVARDITELHHAETELKAERDYLQAIIETSAGTLTVLDESGQIIFANAEAERILGVSAREAEQRRFNSTEWKIICDDGGPFPHDELPFAVVMRTGRSVRNIRHAIESSDGERRHLSINAAPVRVNGQLLVVCQVNDVTSLFTAQAALQGANQRLDLAVTGSLMSIWDNDMMKRKLYFSPRFNEIIGGPPGDWTGSTDEFLDRLHPEDRPRIEAAVQRHLATDEPYSEEMRLRDERGGYVHVRVRGRAIRDEAGEAIRMAGSLIDITAERAAEAEARREGVRAQIALRAGKLGVWEQDGATGLVSMDATLAELMGRPELADTPMTPKEAYAFTHPDDLDQAAGLLRRLVAGEVDEIQSEHRIVKRDGTPVWVLAQVGVVGRDASGKPLRLVGITQDLTERKAAELRLKELLDAAEAASAAKSQFLANMSHEIRTPLNGVLGMAQLMEMTNLDARQRSYLETIRSSGRALQAVIEDVLDISRIEAGKLTLAPEPALTGDIIARTLATIAGEAARKRLEIVTEIDPALETPVSVDSQRLIQVLTNLISNAVKFTGRGQIAVRARALPGGWIRFEVQDTGPGLDRTLQQRVFERFSQADMSPSRAHGGAGLGLAIARELTELAGGRIGVDSEPGQGALFWVEQPAPPSGPIEPTQAESPTPPPPGPARRVLVVEDNPVNRAVASGMLNQAGFVVCEAACAADALAYLRQGGVDAMLLDLHMPGMGGDEALRRIRAGEAGPPDLPVFIVTADVTKDARDRLQELGADRFFAKPVDGPALINALRARLTGTAA
ncbi:MAG: PAS domain S-box protein [Oceanicaulis sp.]